MDIASIAGLVLALIGIIGGMRMEGGSLAQIAQPTALLIVFGGTTGAVMLQFPLDIVLAALKQMAGIFLAKARNDEAIIGLLVAFATRARKSGIVSLDDELQHIQDPFLEQALMLAIDGTESSQVRAIMQLEMDNCADHEEQVAQVFEAAGGFSPTVGILGAVLGLIQVMQHLDKIEEVGRGIAVAFVATIYGVGLANLVCLPVAGKLKIRFHEKRRTKELMLEGVISILEGMNPRMIETKLRTYLHHEKQHPKTAQAGVQNAKLTASEGMA
jgi:chemotaxis protein MotA